MLSIGPSDVLHEPYRMIYRFPSLLCLDHSDMQKAEILIVLNGSVPLARDQLLGIETTVNS